VSADGADTAAGARGEPSADAADTPVSAARRLRHDLRTPLTIVSGFAEILAADRPVSDEDRRDYAQRIVAAAEEIRELIDAARLAGE
jgi:signal transduction histidine kinase